jgi:hypothetical protein
VSNYYRDRAYCIRSTGLGSKYEGGRCVNRDCDRQASAKVLELAGKAGVPIGWADLRTSRCGFVAEQISKAEP